MTKNSYTQAANPTLPLADHPLVDSSGRITPPWHRLLIDLVKKTGGSGNSTPSSIYVTHASAVPASQTTSGSVVALPGGLSTVPVSGDNASAYLTGTGAFLGRVLLTAGAGAKPTVVPTNASPETFMAETSGLLLIGNVGASPTMDVEMSRDGGASFFPAGSAGGSYQLRASDLLKITWSGVTPQFTWMPD